MMGDVPDAVTRATDLANKFEQHVYSTTHTREEYFHLILLRVQQLQQQRKKAELALHHQHQQQQQHQQSAAASAASTAAAMAEGAASAAVELCEADRLIVQQKLAKMATILPVLEQLLAHPQAYAIEQNLLMRCSSLRTMVKKQLALLPQKIYLMNVTMATNVIDQLQHFTNQLKGFLIGEDEMAAGTAVGPPNTSPGATNLLRPASSRTAVARDLARGGPASRVKNDLISDEERSIVSWLQMRGEQLYHPRREEQLSSPPAWLRPGDARWGAEALSTSLSIIEYEIDALQRQHQGHLSIVYGIYPWGTAFRITHRRLGHSLGLRIFEHNYPLAARKGGDEGEIDGPIAFELLPLNFFWGGAAAEAAAVMGLAEEWSERGGRGGSIAGGRPGVRQDDWQLFPPVTLTTVVNLFLHRLVQ